MAPVDTSPQPGHIRARRIQEKLSQQRLAELAGCSLSMIRLLEAGYEPADSAVVPRIERVLDDFGPGANRAESQKLASGVATDEA